jgi:hypothetical protein
VSFSDVIGHGCGGVVRLCREPPEDGLHLLLTGRLARGEGAPPGGRPSERISRRGKGRGGEHHRFRAQLTVVLEWTCR